MGATNPAPGPDADALEVAEFLGTPDDLWTPAWFRQLPLSEQLSLLDQGNAEARDHFGGLWHSRTIRCPRCSVRNREDVRPGPVHCRECGRVVIEIVGVL